MIPKNLKLKSSSLCERFYESTFLSWSPPLPLSIINCVSWSSLAKYLLFPKGLNYISVPFISLLLGVTTVRHFALLYLGDNCPTLLCIFCLTVNTEIYRQLYTVRSARSKGNDIRTYVGAPNETSESLSGSSESLKNSKKSQKAPRKP